MTTTRTQEKQRVHAAGSWHRWRIGAAALGVALLVIAILAASGPGDTKAATSGAQQPTGTPAADPDNPPCLYAPWGPYHNIRTTCIEAVYDNVTPPEAVPALTGLAFAPDGTLYFARTAFGEIWAVRDDDGDRYMDEPVLVADGLNLPSGIAALNRALYILTVDGVFRLYDADDDGFFERQTALIDDLALDTTGFWAGSIGIGPDRRLYVSVGAGCNACEDGDPRRGVLLSYAPDGSDERIEASGLRFPADFAWHPTTGELWIVDSAPVTPGKGTSGPPDELNRVVPGADYGFPGCTGDQQPDAAACTDTELPLFTFPHQSNPTGLAFYTGQAFRDFRRGDLVVAFNGSWTLPEPAGYAVSVVRFTGGEPDGRILNLAPVGTGQYVEFSVGELSLSGRGFYPYRPVDVVVSPEGWIYLSLAEGRIARLRPRPAGHVPQPPPPTPTAAPTIAWEE
ncbi:MAG: PQQ-dependent sugar dehydrogenase [Anaerolineae bacterium]|nr:PQQ-dependent sugar dehydrogenase [Anaerolineae bacterium]